MNKKYPDHFYEPIRIEIAAQQMKHDFRKLMSSVNPKEWPKIDKDIDKWFEGELFELEPVHDFWNFFGGLARGLKLKSLTSWVTASNVVWTKEDVPLEKIIITWDFPGLDFMPKAPYPAKEVIKEFKKSELAKQKADLIKESQSRSKKYMPRDHFPIILFHDADGGVIDSYKGYYILEGNRRTVKAIVNDKPTILAYVGRFTDQKDKWPRNYWLKTGILRDLIFMGIGYDKEKDEPAFLAIRKLYQLLLRDFDIARIATFDKAFKTFESSERLIKDIMLEDFK